MNLSQLVHENRHSSHFYQPFLSSYQQQQSVYPQSKLGQHYDINMASAPYHSAPNPNSRRASQLPSPPVEDRSNYTLPSIQNLIGMADGSPVTRDPASSDVDASQSYPVRGNDQVADERSFSYGQTTVSNLKAFPPTHLLSQYSDSDGSYQSPSAASSRSSMSMPHYSGGSINNIEPTQQRQAPSQPTESSIYGIPRNPPQSPYVNSAYASSPGTLSNYAYPSPAIPPAAQGGMYFQRPLPTTFPPVDISGNVAPVMPNVHDTSPTDHTNPWQHHHYIAPSASSAFANQPTDRYICPTCAKAFSRPSSLRIHSHSHTGEKPYKCMHVGCGKAFSVRSNMKRHERGCHGSGGSPHST